MRFTLLVMLAIVLGTALFMGCVWLLDSGECNRGDCSWLGDLANGDSAGILWGACLLVAGGVVWGIDRLLGRAMRRMSR